ncbi:gliding motility-associated C-terminal domain-containing protein [Hymenobacter sp. 5516J-16]|uniref:gliding motility-associated C-terminal domain-containing protein n=1 Tax=Hymenobacter sp. 5516J-16 TaxID=2932253 RepID=UPI001FD3090F|nr:gliding motility-associated C-terminal domain-containing protein [Hymenobacter sp. 5516J-16]UOQ76876.1 gliding motility-associated C-terminal domain-containing protein [Hymenobacter sp. 5516J-16]
MKKLLVFLLMLGLGSLWAHTGALAQCAPTPNSGACFKAYDAATGQEMPFYLCVGRPVRLRDCSGKNLDPAQIYYQRGSAITCSGFRDTATSFTPTAAGVLVITQNTQGPQGGSQGIIFSRNFEVKSTPAPTFTLTTCAPGFVEVTVTDATYDQYFVQVGNGAPVAAARNTPATYPTNGANQVKVIGQYAIASLCAGTNPQTFTPLPTPQRPTLTSLTVQGGAVQFQFTGLQAEYQYRLQVADAAAAGGYRTVATVPSSATSFTLNNAPLPGCYRLLLQDACQPSVASTPSLEVCSVSLTGTSQNGRNILRWTNQGNGSYALTRTDGPNTIRITLPAGSSQYEDTTASCGTTYRYRLSQTLGSTTSVSDEVALTTTAGLAPTPPRLAATFNLRNQVELSALLVRSPPNSQLTYLRNGSELRVTAARTVTDSLVSPALTTPVCYSVRFLDACGNRSAESPAVCPVLLEATPATDDGSTIRLTWTALRGPDPTAPVSYRVLTLSPTNAVLSSRSVAAGLTYLDLQPPQDQQVVRYRIEATGGGQLLVPSYSNVASVARAVKVFVPTAFTPNGDGLNDVLELKGRYLDNFRFTVVDRNGQQVFQATSRTQTWDGRIGSAPPAPGTYVWRFESTDQTGKRSAQSGTVSILR